MSDCLIDKHLYIYKMKTYMYMKNLLEKNDVFYYIYFSLIKNHILEFISMRLITVIWLLIQSIIKHM